MVGSLGSSKSMYQRRAQGVFLQYKHYPLSLEIGPGAHRGWDTRYVKLNKGRQDKEKVQA